MWIATLAAQIIGRCTCGRKAVFVGAESERVLNPALKREISRSAIVFGNERKWFSAGCAADADHLKIGRQAIDHGFAGRACACSGQHKDTLQAQLGYAAVAHNIVD
jgi:hypothetical protein